VNDASGLHQTESADKQRSEAERFLQKLRPGGPWVLTAIVPDGDTVTITAHDREEIAAFIREHDGKRNIYYAVNPLRREMSKKAAKTDAAAIEFALADLDPNEGESPDAAKARYLTQLNGGSFKPRPTTAVDSGNGLQCLWRFKDRIALGKARQSPSQRQKHRQAGIQAQVRGCGSGRYRRRRGTHQGHHGAARR